MDTNDWLQLFDHRIRQLTEALDQHRTTSPLAAAKLEELLQDVQHIRDEMYPPEN